MNTSPLRAAALALAAAIVVPAAATAQPRIEPPAAPATLPPGTPLVPVPATWGTPEPDDYRRRWYGWQILAVDAAVIALMASSDSPSTANAGLVGLMLGGPIIHGLHGHGGRAAGSLGLRLGLPLAGGALASAGCDEESQTDFFGCTDDIIGGVLLGAIAAEVIDLAWAHDEVPVYERRFAPVVKLDRGATTVGVSGRF